jgi:Ser/Thr protein kinase RdoA (MazF antagonist)
MNPLSQITGKFLITGNIREVVPFGSGHIHETYHVITEPDQLDDYVIQQINTNVFRDPEAVMHNIGLVTSHIREKLAASPVKRTVLQPVRLKDGGLMYIDALNRVWRCFVYIPRHISFDRAQNPAQVYEGGRAYGEFLQLLADLPVDKIRYTIRDFHNLDFRIRQFQEALQSGVGERIKETSGEIALLQARQDEMRTILKLGEQGRIALRVVHHDTKINNVLFNQDHKALCVIDLDTVMPGYVHDDFGDAIRTFTNTGDEDDPDLRCVSMNLEYYKAFAAGFLEMTGGMLSPQEKEHLALSARVMTYMQVLRFLTDYLNGDVYYRIHHPAHNLQRTRAQLKLLMSMEEQYDDMKRIISGLT